MTEIFRDVLMVCFNREALLECGSLPYQLLNTRLGDLTCGGHLKAHNELQSNFYSTHWYTCIWSNQKKYQRYQFIQTANATSILWPDAGPFINELESSNKSQWSLFARRTYFFSPCFLITFSNINCKKTELYLF